MSLKIRASQIRAILCAAVTLGFMGPALAQTAPAPVSPIKLTQQKRPAAQPSKILGPIAQTAASQPAASQAQPVRLASAPTTLQLKSEPSQPDWTKVCGKPTRDAPEVCYTSRDFVSDQGQPVLAFAVYDIKSAQPAKLVR